MARYFVYKDGSEQFPWFFMNLATGCDEGSCSTQVEAFSYAYSLSEKAD